MEDKNIKVSVLVATYNQEKYIGHTLSSIISQNVNFRYEVLVGEDCSSDKTASIIAEYAAKYPQIIFPYYRKNNLGMFCNLPELMTHAKGQYIAFIEGDDYWIDDYKLQKQVDFLDANPDYVACFGKCIIVDEKDIRHPEKEEYNAFKRDEGDYTIKDFEKYVLPGQTATSMYRAVGYENLAQKLSEANIDTSKMIDRDAVLCMMSVGKMYNIGDELAAYRHIMDTSSGSWSSKNDNYNADNVIQYLNGMKHMEKIAKALSLRLDFDERRSYELCKLFDNMDKFSKGDIAKIKKRIKKDYNFIWNYYKSYWNAKMKHRS